MKTFRLKYKTFLLLLPLCILGVVSSCSDDDDDNGASGFRIIKTEIQSDPAVLEGTIELSSPNFEFEVKHDWCTVVQEGNFLKISAGPNYKFVNRSTEITIKSGSFQKNVPITQTGVLFEFTTTNIDVFKYGMLGGKRSLRILSNVDYQYSVSEGDEKWIAINPKDNGEYDIVVSEAEDRRNGSVSFKYLDIELKVDISQYRYMSYEDLLGPAKMFYKDADGNSFETEITFENYKENDILHLRGTFQSGIERTIPVKYIENLEGELRFIPSILDPNFEAPEVDAKIKTLSTVLVAKQEDKNGKVKSDTYAYPSSSGYYYPASFEFLGEGSADVKYKFSHTKEGFEDHYILSSLISIRTTKGIVIKGTNDRGSIAYGDPYDVLYDIEIIKMADN